MANITKWFGYPIYITSIKNFKEINKEIVPIISENVTPTNSQYSQTTDVKPINLQSIDDNLHLDKRFNLLFNEIEQGIRGSMLLQNYNIDLLEFYITKLPDAAGYSALAKLVSSHLEK